MYTYRSKECDLSLFLSVRLRQVLLYLIICKHMNAPLSRVGISGTTTKSRQRKFVPSSHPGPFAAVATSRKSQTKVGTLACFDLFLKNGLTM